MPSISNGGTRVDRGGAEHHLLRRARIQEGSHATLTPWHTVAESTRLFRCPRRTLPSPFLDSLWDVKTTVFEYTALHPLSDSRVGFLSFRLKTPYR